MSEFRFLSWIFVFVMLVSTVLGYTTFLNDTHLYVNHAFISNSLLVNGSEVCLEDGTNCPEMLGTIGFANQFVLFNAKYLAKFNGTNWNKELDHDILSYLSFHSQVNNILKFNSSASLNWSLSYDSDTLLNSGCSSDQTLVWNQTSKKWVCSYGESDMFVPFDTGIRLNQKYHSLVLSSEGIVLGPNPSYTVDVFYPNFFVEGNSRFRSLSFSDRGLFIKNLLGDGAIYNFVENDNIFLLSSLGSNFHNEYYQIYMNLNGTRILSSPMSPLEVLDSDDDVILSFINGDDYLLKLDANLHLSGDLIIHSLDDSRTTFFNNPSFKGVDRVRLPVINADPDSYDSPDCNPLGDSCTEGMINVIDFHYNCDELDSYLYVCLNDKWVRLWP